MAANKGSRIWWWVVPLVVILGGLGYYWYTKGGPVTPTIPAAKDTSLTQKPGAPPGTETGPGGPLVSGPIPKKTLPEEGSNASTSPTEKAEDAESSVLAAQGPIEELMLSSETASKAAQPSPGQGAYCTLIDRRVSDFFESVDSQPYFRRYKAEKDAYTHVTQIMKRLAAQPPEPAGEGINPTALLTNIYFFSRALQRKDLLLIKEIMANERDALEFDLETFYRWLMLGSACPNSDNVRPSFDVVYRYAGFFLNTTGGRSCLFRRPLRLRLLTSYYCVLILYQADRLGKNSYGLDVLPYIQPLKDELRHHPELEFQDAYMSTLDRIGNYYLQKR